MSPFRIAATAATALMAAPAIALAAGAALVIGNADYQHAPRALSADKDAEAMAGALSEAGFDVVSGVDLDRAGLRQAMDDFAALIDGADSVVIFYSGQTVRMGGGGYLAPIEFAPDDPVAVAMDGAPLAALTALAGLKPGAALVFVDGSHEQGFAPSAFAEPGIADIAAPDGVLVVSAAAPGQTSAHSRWRPSAFVSAIIDGFLAEGVPAMDAADGLPAPIWAAGGLDPALTLVAAPAPAANDDLAQQVELAFWKSVEGSGKRQDYEAYLNRYPDGLFAEIARNRIGAAAPAPQQTAAERAEARERALNLSREERRRIQADLTALGFDTNGVDGIFGRGTRGAIRNWQNSEELPSTGYLSADELPLLRSVAQAALDERERLAAEQAAMSAEEKRREDDALWRRTQEIGTVGAYQRYLHFYPEGRHSAKARDVLAATARRNDDEAFAEARRIDNRAAYAAYLDRYPDGRHAVEAQRRHNRAGSGSGNRVGDRLLAVERAWKDASAENTPKAYREFREKYPDSEYAEEADRRRIELRDQQRAERENRLGLTAQEWVSIERRLAALGYDVGDIDGRPSGKLREAIKDFRRSRGLNVHGYVGKRFVKVLVEETHGRGSSNPLDQMLRLMTGQ